MAGVSFYNLPAVNPYLLSNYPGAAAAYSLRKLRGSYSGSAIRVRRASDNAEQDIGFVGEDLDTAALTSFCTGTDGFVTTWYDQELSNSVSQATAAYQPKVHDSSTGVITKDGKPAILFDGTNDYLISTNPNQTVTDFYTFMVFQKTVTGNERFILLYNNTSTRNAQIGIGDTFIRTWYSTDLSILTSANMTAQNNLITHHYSTTTGVSIDYNGSNILNSAAITTFNTNFSDIKISGRGGGLALLNVMAGTIQEMVIYTADKSGVKAGIQSNINNYYNIYP